MPRGEDTGPFTVPSVTVRSAQIRRRLRQVVRRVVPTKSSSGKGFGLTQGESGTDQPHHRPSPLTGMGLWPREGQARIPSTPDKCRPV